MSHDDRRNQWSDFADGFTEEQRQVVVPPASPLGQAMADYRERLARGEVEPLDPDFKIVPVPVED
jgi:hypothetical protein